MYGCSMYGCMVVCMYVYMCVCVWLYSCMDGGCMYGFISVEMMIIIGIDRYNYYDHHYHQQHHHHPH